MERGQKLYFCQFEASFFSLGGLPGSGLGSAAQGLLSQREGASPALRFPLRRSGSKASPLQGHLPWGAASVCAGWRATDTCFVFQSIDFGMIWDLQRSCKGIAQECLFTLPRSHPPPMSHVCQDKPDSGPCRQPHLHLSHTSFPLTPLSGPGAHPGRRALVSCHISWSALVCDNCSFLPSPSPQFPF